MKPEQPKLRTQLDRNEWIDGAIEALANDGLAGMCVESLAKQFGVTKGSFYWHFKDRQDLINAVLQTWKQGRIGDVDKHGNAVPGKESDQLFQIIEVYGANRNRKGISIELAMRDWARRDPQARAVVDEVDAYRMESARKLFVANGLADDEAKSRSFMLYAYMLGQSLMAYDRYDQQAVEIKHWIARRIVTD